MNKVIALLFCCYTISVTAQEYKPSPENLKTRRWFDSAKFGMFIHWGASSVLGAGEWVMNNRNIKVNDYNRLLQIFNPQDFNAKAWVETAKSAGMQYITFISRHHDGFSNWDTKASEWKITNTPYGKDVLKALANECHRQNIKLFVYYSLLDWYRSDYQYESGRTGKGTGRKEKSDWASYINFMKTQLTELLTNYGEIAGVWFDGHWDQLKNDKDKTGVSNVDWHYNEIYKLIHTLQPQCMIGNNHHLAPIAGEDFQMFEKDLPGANTTGFGGATVSELPLETCETINDSWGFNITDTKYKTPKQLIDYLVKASGNGANFLLNIGPMPNGKIQPEFITNLKAVGDWLKVYGPTIYGTKPGFTAPQPWGAITKKGNKVFIHLLNKKENTFLVNVPYKIKSAKKFDDGSIVKFKTLPGNFIEFDITHFAKDEIDNVIELER